MYWEASFWQEHITDTRNNMEQKNFTKAQCAAFTGHRLLPFGKPEYLKEQIKNAIIEYYAEGIHNYFCGMAMGFDLLAAETIMSLKNELANLHLTAVVPYRNQYERWHMRDQVRYMAIIDKADRVIILSEQYFNGCLLRRNDYMLSHSSRLIAYFNGKPQGGTFYTYRKAQSKGMPVTNLYP